jgi:hypothetical protein
MPRRRRKKRFLPRIRFKKKFPFVQLGSSTSVHEERAAYHRRSEETAVARGLSQMKAGNCHKAFNELLSAKLYDGMRWAHAESAGMKNAAIAPYTRSTSVTEFEVAFLRACPIGGRDTMHGARRRKR